MTNRHNPDPVTAEAIRIARAELRGEIPGRWPSMVNYRIGIGNLALWGRDLPMRSWTYEEACGNQRRVLP